jgi:hypothetical protein
MDGINYSECEMAFKIYSNDIGPSTIMPKSASVKGGTEAVMNLDIDEITAQCIQNLTVGFQPKQRKTQQAGITHAENKSQLQEGTKEASLN